MFLYFITRPNNKKVYFYLSSAVDKIFTINVPMAGVHSTHSPILGHNLLQFYTFNDFHTYKEVDYRSV